MTTHRQASTSHVRDEWLAAVLDQIQSAVGHVMRLDRNEAAVFLRRVAETLRPPATFAESAILRSLLIELAAECGSMLHGGAHSARDTTCAFQPTLLLPLLWKPRTVPPARAFANWVDAYFKDLDDAHPRSLANRIAELIRREFHQQWPVEELARRVHMSPSQLARAFAREYGTSIADYRRAVRLIEALERVRHEKIDAVALDIGYHSRKNFYGAFRRVTGLTPTQFRALSSHHAQQIIESARLTMGRHNAPVLARQATTRTSKAMAADSRSRLLIRP